MDNFRNDANLMQNCPTARGSLRPNRKQQKEFNLETIDSSFRPMHFSTNSPVPGMKNFLPPGLNRSNDFVFVLPSTRHSTTESGAAAGFRTTHWTVVLAAARSGAPQTREAMGKLCQTYWYPLYAFIRRRGHNDADAKDLTQGFFFRLLDKNYLEGITIEGGKFRSYLLTLLNHFMSDERERARALKRGGGQTLISIDEESEEGLHYNEPTIDVTPEVEFERTWAMALLNEVMGKLRREYAAEGNAELFEALRPCLTGAERVLPYSELGRGLGRSEGAVKVAVLRLRRRYGELLRTQIAETVESPAEVESEIRHLIEVASG